ncbi:MAG: hypothetical protein HY842_08685, partial [Bacteroidetes bacterium]|nr:hypothetical protein [Bacteroidota bacterium]
RGRQIFWADQNRKAGLPNKFGHHKPGWCLVALLLLTAWLPTANSQQPTAKNFTTDNLGNLYLLTPDNEVIKYTPDGQEQFRYPNKTLGEATYLDATNPFHLLLFYPEYQTVLTLDRTLSLTGQFNLLQFGLLGAQAVGMSGDGMLWVYDETSFLLKKMAADGTVVVRSADLSLATGQSFRPNFLVEREQTVFVNDPAVGVLVFDVFGQYRKTIDLKGLQEFQVLDDQLIYNRDGQLWSFHLKALLEKPFSLPVQLPQGSKVRVGNGLLYVLDAGILKTYPL